MLKLNFRKDCRRLDIQIHIPTLIGPIPGWRGFQQGSCLVIRSADNSSPYAGRGPGQIVVFLAFVEPTCANDPLIILLCYYGSFVTATRWMSLASMAHRWHGQYVHMQAYDGRVGFQSKDKDCLLHYSCVTTQSSKRECSVQTNRWKSIVSGNRSHAKNAEYVHRRSERLRRITAAQYKNSASYSDGFMLD